MANHLIGWENDNPPAINETNLNIIDQGIYNANVAVENKNTEIYNGYDSVILSFENGWINGSGEYDSSDDRFLSNAVATNDLIEVTNNSQSAIYIVYFTSFTSLSNYTFADVTSVSIGTSKTINKSYPYILIESSATNRNNLDGIVLKKDSIIEYLSHENINSMEDAIDDSGLSWNIIPYDYYSGDDYTNNGIHFVKNSDGSVSSSGTATDQARYYWIYNGTVPAGTYEIGGMPDGGTSNTFMLEYLINGTIYPINRPTTITINNGDVISIRTYFKAGYVDSGKTWRVYLGNNFGVLNNQYNPKYFVPLVIENKDSFEHVTNLENNVHWEYFQSTYVIGSLNSSGREVSSTTRVRSGYIPTQSCKLYCPDGYRYGIFYYSTSSSPASAAQQYWITGEYTLLTTYPYFRYVVEKVPAETVASSDVNDYGAKVRIDIRSILIKNIDSISDRVSALENEDALPDYWETYLETKIPVINSEIRNIGNHGIVFAFFTDYHYPQQEIQYGGTLWLPKILHRLKNDCYFNTIIQGGDILTNNPTKAEAIEFLEKYRSDYMPLDVLTVLGNHDTNPYTTGGSENILSDDEVYAILYRGTGMEKLTELDKSMSWYIDNHTQKTRIIAINSNYESLTNWNLKTDVHQWLVDTLESVPDGYTIVVIPHVFFGLSSEGGTEHVIITSVGENIQAIVDAYQNRGNGTWNNINYDFTNAGGEIACIIAGHAHNDDNFTSEAGYPIICVVCDAMYGTHQSVVRGNSAKYSVAEHAFDIVCINTDSQTKSIKCIRVGSGSDRNFTY